MSDKIEIKITPSKSGRYAILARRDQRWPWIQIASVSGHYNAKYLVDNYKLCDELLADEEEDVDPLSKEAVDEANSKWGEDSPMKFPTD